MNVFQMIPKFLFANYLLILSCALSAQEGLQFQYINPKPASVMVSGETNIILRYAGFINRATVDSDLIFVEGSASGIHSGELLLTDDNRTLVFNPDQAFVTSELVEVSIKEGVKTRSGTTVPEFSFSFRTAKAGIARIPEEAFAGMDLYIEDQDPNALKGVEEVASLPPPPITIDSIDNPSDGYIFLATWDRNMPALYGNFIFILDKIGAIVDSLRVKGAPYDFQVQPNGLLSYALGDFASNVPPSGRGVAAYGAG